MKNILNLNGIKTLSKKEQSNVFGAARLASSCQQKGRICCQGGACDLGSCVTAGGSSFCMWY